jgi:hypothetical protein
MGVRKDTGKRAMKAKGIRCEVGLLVLLACALAALAAHAQENCTPVHLERGKSLAIIHGTAPPEDVICYTFGTGAGQTTNLKVSGSNMIISVVGIGDARESWTFKTKAQTYKFIVGQLMRSVSNTKGSAV